MNNNRYDIEREFNKAVDLYYNMEKYKKKLAWNTYLRESNIRRNELMPGHLYLVDNNTMQLFIGNTEQGKLVFYTIAGCVYTVTQYKCMIIKTLMHYNSQVDALIAMAKSVISKPLDVTALKISNEIPCILCEFKYINFEEKCTGWYINEYNKKTNNLPKLINIVGNKESKSFVKAGELIVGEACYSGTGQYSTYIYLGRDKDTKDFISK